jgi:hypothetical protein
MVDDYLDGYINSLYRSLKSHRDGRPELAHLDAAESVPYLLTALFALDRRVRPYNKYLRWELERHPLSDPRWSVNLLLVDLRRIIADGDPSAQPATASGPRGPFSGVARHWGRARGVGRCAPL